MALMARGSLRRRGETGVVHDSGLVQLVPSLHLLYVTGKMSRSHPNV